MGKRNYIRNQRLGDFNSWVDGELFAIERAIASIPGQLDGEEVAGTDYTLVLGDQDKCKKTTNGSAVTITVPTHAAVPFELGALVYFYQEGEGTVTLEGDTGVIINGRPGLVSGGQHALFFIWKEADNVWAASGDLGGGGGGGGGDHAAVTVVDSDSIDFTLTGQQITAVAKFGTGAGTVCEGNDSRLSDSRTPTSHDQAWSTITSTPTTLSGYGITDAQPLDTQLTDLAALSYSGNGLKVVRVNAGETAFELATSSGGGLTAAQVASIVSIRF